MHFQMNFKDGISLKCSALCSKKKKSLCKVAFWMDFIDIFYC